MERPKRKVWFEEKIEKLESEVSQLKLSQPSNGVDKNSYALGVYETMCKYQLLSKEQRRRIRDNIIANGIEQFSRSKNPWKM